MTCAACGQQLPDRAAFCSACGAAVGRRACATCGEELGPGAAFCIGCGTPVGPAAQRPGPGATPAVPSAERRLSSVLFADLVSYTTLSESRDTEDVRELLSRYFEVCSTVVGRYGGTVEKFIGDAVMAVWGVPTAHEDDAERAVRAALELVAGVEALGEQTGLPELRLRAGVVTGEVAANLAATNQGMVAGDPVNTAARIQTAAGPGEVWVDAATRSLTAAAVTYTDEGLHALKGKADRVHLFRVGTVVAAIGGQQRVDGLEAPLAGRERELRLVKELFHATEESGRPRLVVLDGDAGTGKSRLGWEFEKYVDGLKTPVAWHRGRCLSYGEGVAYWALAEIVRGRVGLVEDQHGALALDALDRQLLESVADEEERSWLRPRIASLLGEESREFAREDLFAAWTRFLERVGGGDPLVLLVDDAQYADDGLLDFVESLLANSRTPMFVLLLARPELLEGRPQLGGRRLSAVRLEPLPDAAMRQLLDGLVEGFPDEVREELVRRSEGVPLYAVETVRALIDRDLVRPSDGRYIVDPAHRIDLTEVGAPASLHALVAARLDGLDQVERRVVADASVLGESFTREGIGVLAADVPDLDDVLAGLQRKELIATDSDRFSAERGQFRFVQSVVRQVAYSTLSKHDRRTRHLLVAEHLEQESDRVEDIAQVIARHLIDAADASGVEDSETTQLRARAGRLLVTAGDRAWALGSYGDSLRSYDSALGCLPEGASADRAHALLLRARACERLARPDEAAATAREAMAAHDALGDRIGAAEAACEIAMATSSFARDDGLEVARQRYADIADLAGADRVRGRLALAIARSLHFLGRFTEVREPLDEALRVSDHVEDPLLFRGACNILALNQMLLGSRQMARMIFDDIAAQARREDDWMTLSTALTNIGVMTAPVDLRGATAAAEEAVSCKVDHGIPAQAQVTANLMNMLWLSGRWDDLEDLVGQVKEELDYPLSSLVAAASERLCAWAGRDLVGGRVEVPEGVEGNLETVAHYHRAVAALAETDLAAAVQEAVRTVRMEFGFSGVIDDFVFYWPTALRIALLAGDRAATAELLDLVDSSPITPMGSIAAHATFFRALLAIRDGDADAARAEASLRAGIDGLERSGVVVWRAHAQEDLGRLLLEQGRPNDAEPLLRAARETYTDLGATSWLARLDALAGVQS